MRPFRAIFCIATLAAMFFAGWRVGRQPVEIRTVTHVDTVFYERPQPVRISYKLTSVTVPRILFAPPDTLVQTVAFGNGCDSVQIDVPVQTLEYRDSTYYARVSGPVVGSLVPQLDWIETYNRTITQTTTKRNRFAVTAGVGVGYTPQGLQPTVGVQVGVVLWSW